jgi:hypothetical protein
MVSQTRKKTRLFDPNPRGKPRIQGLGFQSAEKARESLEKIKKMPTNYQRQVITTMYYRAKHHPHQTKKMRNAMKIYKQHLIRKH